MAQRREDIEDVLSSVRRLVSGEASRKDEAQALVLDESSRVAEPDDPYQPVRTAADAPLDEAADEAAEAPSDAAAPERGATLNGGPAESISDAGLEALEGLVQEEMDDNDAAIIDAPEAAEPRFEVPPPMGLRRIAAPEADVSATSETPSDASAGIGGPVPPVDPDRDTGEDGNAFEEIDLSDRIPVRDGHVSAKALREIIADVVREELSGELGERITRNVRKLVRREIRKVLAADELE